jgi:hypothetical protein
MSNAIAPAEEGVSSAKRALLIMVRTPTGVGAGTVVRLGLMMGPAIAPADLGTSDAKRVPSTEVPDSHTCIDAAAIVRQA